MGDLEPGTDSAHGFMALRRSFSYDARSLRRRGNVIVHAAVLSIVVKIFVIDYYHFSIR
jgi:hypothetical protein